MASIILKASVLILDITDVSESRRYSVKVDDVPPIKEWFKLEIRHIIPQYDVVIFRPPDGDHIKMGDQLIKSRY